MLYIKCIRGTSLHPIEWHVGEVLPEIHGPVVSFQADGHELTMILDTIRAHSREQ